MACYPGYKSLKKLVIKFRTTFLRLNYGDSGTHGNGLHSAAQQPVLCTNIIIVTNLLLDVYCPEKIFDII